MCVCNTCRETCGQCDVLEIGFGCGYSADHIQSFHPRSHTIVECSTAVLSRLTSWAEGKVGVVVVAGTWQAAMPHLGHFDAIFFDDFPLPTACGAPTASQHDAVPSAVATVTVKQDAARAPAPGALPVRHEHPLLSPAMAARFTDEELAKLDTRWSAIVDLCAGWHMKSGARLSGYFARNVAIDHPDCDVCMTPVRVYVPPHCPYFSGDVLYVPRIVRKPLHQASSTHTLGDGRAAQRPCAAVSSVQPGLGTCAPPPSKRKRRRSRLKDAVLQRLGLGPV